MPFCRSYAIFIPVFPKKNELAFPEKNGLFFPKKNGFSLPEKNEKNGLDMMCIVKYNVYGKTQKKTDEGMILMGSYDYKKNYNMAYDKAFQRRFALNVNKIHEADIIDHLEAQDSIQGYIKRLIREDMQKKAQKS